MITERGFLALSCSPDLRPEAADELRARIGECLPGALVLERGGLTTATWGIEPPDRDGVVLLSRAPRRHSRDLGPAEISAALTADDPGGLAQVLPTFAAARVIGEDVRVAADVLGFRHLCTVSGPGWTAVSTASLPAAALAGAAPDEHGLAVASLLGWQVGQRTLFEGVDKVRPGVRLTLREGTTRSDRFASPDPAPAVSMGEGVDRAATLLRDWMRDYLDDHPDAVLQLTGGQDSRLLLSAVPEARRRGLRVVTMGSPGHPDVEIAAALARRYGMDHQVLAVDGVADLDPETAHDLCVVAARRVDYTADPLAHAALAIAESRAEEGPRISGLGGEVARGFYYLGPVTTSRPTARRAARLARWRMFVNEAVAVEALDPRFAAWARDVAFAEVVDILTSHPGSWFQATDHLYLHHRMQRWGGITETAVCLDRDVVNPMLDDRFVAIANGLAPSDKAGSKFLSRVQVALDEELARLPLDGRPAPVSYAERSATNSAQRTMTAAGKLRRKAVQRLHHRPSAPVGGPALSALVVRHWRRYPDLLAEVRGLAVFSDNWLDAMLVGEVDPDPSTVALLINLEAAVACHTQSWGSPVDRVQGRA